MHWFEAKLADKSCLLLIYSDLSGQDIGQVRFQKDEDNAAIISISVAAEHRGKGYAKNMLISASDYFLAENSNSKIKAYIKETNIGSIHSFEKAGFLFEGEMIFNEVPSVYFSKVK